ncbi:hypothetical protein BJ322DRAFT_1112601 [Thelephora terrestris]|uniref:Uncharacterized protein n=1 Tax=Thelephora terrestris TaxID=56493 RepID=A0A9P6H6M8_9AGAM|nr:hypothetical protein BJ322DRAFT_1112601 [Thelephora terrestris]
MSRADITPASYRRTLPNRLLGSTWVVRTVGQYLPQGEPGGCGEREEDRKHPGVEAGTCRLHWEEVILTGMCSRLATNAAGQDVCRPKSVDLTSSLEQLNILISTYEHRSRFDEILSLLEAGLSLERAHVCQAPYFERIPNSIHCRFTELSIFYSKYRPEKLMEHLKLFVTRINIPRSSGLPRRPISDPSPSCYALRLEWYHSTFHGKSASVTVTGPDRSSDISDLFRKQEELEKSIAALKLLQGPTAQLSSPTSSKRSGESSTTRSEISLIKFPNPRP